MMTLDTGGSLLVKISWRGYTKRMSRYKKKMPNQIKSTTLPAARVETQVINNGYAKSTCNCINIQVTTTTEVFPNAQVIIEKSTTNLDEVNNMIEIGHYFLFQLFFPIFIFTYNLHVMYSYKRYCDKTLFAETRR